MSKHSLYSIPFLCFVTHLFISCGTEPDFQPPGISPNGITIQCPDTNPGDVFVIDSVEYVSVDNESIKTNGAVRI